MDTEYTLQQARFLERQSNELENYAETLQRISNKLSSSWMNGSRSSSFQADLNDLIRQYAAKAQELQVLSNRVRREIDEWLSMDSQGQAKTHQIRDGGTIGKIIAPYVPLYNFIKGNLDPNTLTETRDYLLNTPDGIELERLAIEKGIKFVFEDGSFIGDPNGKEILIHFGPTGDAVKVSRAIGVYLDYTFANVLPVLVRYQHTALVDHHAVFAVFEELLRVTDGLLRALCRCSGILTYVGLRRY